MADLQAQRRWLFPAGAGVALALLAGKGGPVAILAAWLAQPAFALAVRGLRHQRKRVHLRRDALGLAVMWGTGLFVAAAVLAWPVMALRDSATLGHVLIASGALALVLIALWRLWPMWQGVEREGGRLADQWRNLSLLHSAAWRGLGFAALVAIVPLSVLLLAWPDLLASNMRWIAAGLMVAVWPALHWSLQRIQPPDPLPVPPDFFEFDDATPEPLPAVSDDLDGALYDAARGGRVDRALALLEAGADPHALPPLGERDQRSLPVLAAVLPDLRLLRALIAAGVDVNAAHAGMTPLLAATRDSWHGRPEAVMTLLANGADPRAGDAEGNTPLHHAARSSDPGVAALLRDAAAELDVLNRDGVTPLGMACAAGNWRLARFLLERGARPEPPGATPALLAAAGSEEDDAAGVQLLLKHKAKVDARDAIGRSALHEAALAGNLDALDALLAAGADVQARDAHGRTPLLDAARGAHLQVLESLVAAGADVGAVDADGRGALALASIGDAPTVAIVQRLIDLGADPSLADHEGKRAAERAAEAGRWTLVAALDPEYPLPSRVADDTRAAPPPDRTPLSLLRDGLEQPPYEGLDTLARLLSPAELGSLLLDADAPSPARVEWLLAHGADAEARTRHANGDSPRADGAPTDTVPSNDTLPDNVMFQLLARGPSATAAVQALLHRGVSPAGHGGLARFLAACAAGDQASRGYEHCAIALLERGADPFGTSPAGDPPLTLAVRLGWSRLATQLITMGVDLEARDSHGMTALHLAAALGREALLKLLVAQGASPQTRAADGQTPLGVALSAGRRDLADWLDWRGWTLPGRPLMAVDVPAAAIVGDADAVRRLLDLGFDVDTVDAQGCSALLRAAGGGHRTTVDLLLARGADPKRAAHTGATPLSAAVSMRHGEIVDRLLEAGAGLEQRLPGDVTVLMLAAALGLPDLCARLLMAGANVQAQDAQGLTALHCATLFGFTARERPRLIALLDTLLLAGADADAPAGHVTPLLLLLGARAEPGTACDEEVVLTGVERLLDEDVVLDAQDSRGFGPLHLAALHGLLRVTQRLIRAGCDPDLRDTLNRTPREIAVMRGFVDVAGEFLPATAGVSMARFLREPR
ncbi:MAG: ankyrin repeat domain-containing protein [Luteimonas sp.]